MDEAIEMHPKLIGTAPSVDAAPSQNPLCPPTKTVATKAHHRAAKPKNTQSPCTARQYEGAPA